MEFVNRTQYEEMRYCQALGYAWAMQDATKFETCVDSQAFADWYSAQDNKTTISAAFTYFVQFNWTTQGEMGAQNKKGSFVAG